MASAPQSHSETLADGNSHLLSLVKLVSPLSGNWKGKEYGRALMRSLGPGLEVEAITCPSALDLAGTSLVPHS